ncbi:MAG: protein phosphatase 2C domain-containing protein, partial [Phormidesmis sp.]
TGFKFAGLTDIGLHRAANQDSYYISPAGELFLVADGMGGHAGGQEASRLATTTICNYLQAHRDSDRPSEELLEQAILAANQAILSDQRRYPERADMGTTVVLLMVRDDQLWCAHVGDSRLYLLRESKLFQLTEDHTWIAQALQRGDLLPSERQHHPWRHVLSQCVGREDLKSVEIQRLKTVAGDRLLLCSDGLSEELSSEVIGGYLQSAPTCTEAASGLIEAAKARGGHDNITAITLFIP